MEDQPKRGEVAIPDTPAPPSIGQRQEVIERARRFRVFVIEIWNDERVADFALQEIQRQKFEGKL